MITVDTRLVALLGNPLRQSFSHVMQNAAFREHGVDFVYFPVETTEQSLPFVVNAIRHMNFAGCGVTKPDKVRIMPLLDKIDDLAAKIGAINTVVKEEGKLVGYNTDGEGCVRSLRENMDIPIEEARFVCLGAGGSARAVCSTLAHYGAASIGVVDVNEAAAESLVRDINERFRPVAEHLVYGDRRTLQDRINNAHVVMNHTGVGMAATLEESPLPSTMWPRHVLAYDAIYNPAQTRFLRDARDAGCRTLNGLGMLVYQGALQFQMWTGREDPSAIMFAAIEDYLSPKKAKD